MPHKSQQYKLADFAAAKKLPLDFLQQQYELHDLGKGAIGIPYFGESGEKLFVRRRNPPGVETRFVHPKGKKLLPYGLNRLDAARKIGRLCLCEGESDTLTMWHCGLPALGIPGASAVKALQLGHIADLADLYLTPDNDDAGTQFVEGIRRRVVELGFAGRLWSVQVPKQYKDVSDWFVAAGSKEKFLAELETSIQAVELLTVEERRPSRNGVAASDYHGSANASGDKTQRRSVATRLVELVVESGAELFHDAEYKAFATIPAVGHVETLALRSAAFKRWLGRLLHAAEGRAAGNQAVQDAIASLEAKAHYEGEEHAVHVRLAEHDGKVYLDLADKKWRVVEVDTAGWRIADGPPVRFRRPKGLLSLPLPEPGGCLDDLRQFVNIASDADWRLLIVCMLAALRSRGPYPILCLYGQQGSAKSTTASVLRALIDPNAAPLRGEPKEARDVVITATNSWVVCFNNLSWLPPWLSDLLCCLSTGSGYAVRELYTDGEETIFNATRPIIINGIEDLATRGDLLHRGVLLSLPRIHDDRRVTERIFWRNFAAAQPRILGALLQALSGALRELPHVQLSRLPRMADFAELGVAAERALGWRAGSFLDAYKDNRSGANETALEASPVAGVLIRFMEGREEWSGTASELLPELSAIAGDTVAKGKDWPKRANILGGWLNRLDPNLRAVGIIIERGTGRNRRRFKIKTTRGETSSPSSPSSPEQKNEEFSCDDAGDDARPGDDHLATGDNPVTIPGPRIAQKNKGSDAGDDGDAKSQTFSYLAPGVAPDDAVTPFDEENVP